MFGYEERMDAIAETIYIERLSDEELKGMFQYGGDDSGCHFCSWGRIWDAVQDYRDACYW